MGLLAVWMGTSARRRMSSILSVALRETKPPPASTTEYSAPKSRTTPARTPPGSMANVEAKSTMGLLAAWMGTSASRRMSSILSQNVSEVESVNPLAVAGRAAAFRLWATMSSNTGARAAYNAHGPPPQTSTPKDSLVDAGDHTSTYINKRGQTSPHEGAGGPGKLSASTADRRSFPKVVAALNSS
ncbi:unnamed protein product [Pylaiella littoralis]